MNINTLGGVRMPVTTSTDRTTQTAATRFGSLVQGSASTATSGRAGLPGSSVVASAISANSGGAPGFGAPYLQAMSSGVPGAGTPATTATQGQTTAPAAGQEQLKEIMKMSLVSFINTTFAMGQNRPKADDW
ncbi:hypothetical protein [Hyalangium minutum]|uniref:Uncharacterized protein n=1 Tax=Hyalangium minutum TaxID=394096 RepID=A0A085WN35_9BACT|nr:hypothetical protein [Hyalangium minutum]KFE69098.1 hypothetical protein DB31_7000 [Hyalangium minutum]